MPERALELRRVGAWAAAVTLVAWILPGADARYESRRAAEASVPVRPGIPSPSDPGAVSLPPAPTAVATDEGSPAQEAAPEGGVLPQAETGVEVGLTPPAAKLIALDGGRDGLPARLETINAKPGDTATLTLRVRNTGDRAVSLSLAGISRRDVPGPNGGRLSERLRLAVSRQGAAMPVYGGTIPSSRLALGRLAPRATVRFRLAFTFPDGGTPGSPTSGDNRYQGAAVALRYALRAVARR